MAKQAVPRLPMLGVLCSGQGTNLQAILDAAKRGKLKARVAVVLSDKQGTKALARARRAGVATEVIEPALFSSRSAFDKELIKRLQAHRVRLVCLAGFMRVLSPVFIRAYRNRILNVHPALLPAFPGAHAVRDALTAGVKITGVTVHWVDEKVDHGPVILQEAVRILPGDTERVLLKRVHRIEHKLYPEAIRLVLLGRVRVDRRIARIRRKA